MSQPNEAALTQPRFAEFLGMKITHVSRDRVTAEMRARDELNNRHGILHGGAIIALAHNLGGTATTANLQPGQTTTTIESKSNFFAAIPIGDIAYAECTPLHRDPRRRPAVRAGDADPDGAAAEEITISGRQSPMRPRSPPRA